MWYEVERKFHVPGFQSIEAELHKLGAEIDPPITQVDQYFAHPSRDFAETDEAFRVRSVDDANWVTYKGPKIDLTTKTRRELELALPDGESYARQYRQLLEALGFQHVADVRKQRRKSVLRVDDFEVEVAIDDVQGVGPFVELEIGADAATLDRARACLHSLAGKLRLEDEERRSYLELLLHDDG